MNSKLDQRWIGLKRMRRALMHQEQGHRAFGERLVHGLIASGEVDRARVRDMAEDYLFLIDRALGELQPLFEVVGASPELYKSELLKGLPGWIEVPGP
jgi:hypothetical protein